MKRAFLALALACAPAFAVPTHKQPGLTVRLYDTPCAAPVADLLMDSTQFRKASVTFRGREIPACWTPQGGAVAIVDADGDAGVLPLEAFKDEPGV